MIDARKLYRSMQQAKLKKVAERLTLMLLPLSALMIIYLKLLGTPIIFLVGFWLLCVIFVFVVYAHVLR